MHRNKACSKPLMIDLPQLNGFRPKKSILGPWSSKEKTENVWVGCRSNNLDEKTNNIATSNYIPPNIDGDTRG